MLIGLLAQAGLAGPRLNGEGGARSRRPRLATGSHHICTVVDDGTVRCWGSDTKGELGDGTIAVSKSPPVQVSGLIHAISVAAGNAHSCALLAEGTVRCWGFNDAGRLGNGLTTDSAVPVNVSGLDHVVAITAGADYTCAVRLDGTVWCWGGNSLGQLGMTASFGANPLPVQINVSGAIAISAGDAHTCALLSGGAVKCWGRGTNGELGAGLNNVGPQPVMVSNLSGVSDIVAGGRASCALLADGAVSCWGDNFYGQLGATVVGDAFTPAALSLTGAAALTQGETHGCVIMGNGSAQCWGDDSLGQLGDGFTKSRSTPAPAPALADAVEISGGSSYTCALTVTGTVRCWGTNADGEHGIGNTNATLGTDTVSGVAGTVSARGVQAGDAFTCARRGNGIAVCWGRGDFGELGNGQSTSSSPNPVNVIGLTNALGLATGSLHACALDSQGKVRCWGSDFAGQIGDGTSFDGSTIKAQPAFVASGSLFASITGAETHSCGLTVSGRVECWGNNSEGQLGLNSIQAASTPIQVPGIGNAVAITAGEQFTCALLVDGTARCWGANNAHQLGDGGSELNSAPPVTVAGLANAIAISAGTDHVCALSAFGNVSCWGANSSGQIGDGTVNTAPFPETISNLFDATGISAGGQFSCAARAGGLASCWGNNRFGQLAAADSASRQLTSTTVINSFTIVNGTSIPIPLGAVESVSASHLADFDLHEHACALRVNGGIACWGSNSSGQIGDGTTTDRPRPTAANSFTANIDPAVALSQQERIATITALINCEAGEAHIHLTLEQGSVTGSANAVAACANQLARVQVTVPAQGPAGFQPGAAVAQVEAVVMDRGTITQDQRWTREVALALAAPK